MDQEKIKAELDQWMVEFVEANNSQLGNWAPCPYAKAARVADMIGVRFSSVPELTSVVRESIDTLATKDVVVVCFDHNTISPSHLQEFVAGMNKMLMPADYVILEDHPDAPEYVNGVKMNFGQCGLLVIQKLSKLNNAADKLKSQGYYDTWDQKSLDDVVTWRYEK
jgi:kynureninase